MSTETGYGPASTNDTGPEEAQSLPDFVRDWLARIDLARDGKEWAAWRKEAEACEKRHTLETGHVGGEYNLFFANVETVGAATYNSPPVPDIRRRFGDADPPGKLAADVLERAISASMDMYAFDDSIKGVVTQGEVVGWGAVRIKYDERMTQPEPMEMGEGDPMSPEGMEPPEPAIAWQSVYCDPLDWRDFVQAPATAWAGVPWIAFRHEMTRADLVALSPEVGPLVKLDSWIDGADKRSDAQELGERFKKTEVWEVWDRGDKAVYWLARTHKESPLKVEADPLGLPDFFPMARPHTPIEKPFDMTPVPPFRLYKKQADEIDTITKRISALTRTLKARGIYASEFGEAFTALNSLADGQYAPVSQSMAWSDKGIDKGIWTMPIADVIKVLQELHAQRETVKQEIYELIGVADIMRGASAASETLGAQQLKTQWGSLRINRRQQSVARFVRDTLAIKAKIIASKFTPEVLKEMTGIDLATIAPPLLPPGMPMPPELATMMKENQTKAAALDLLRDGMELAYRIDIETDSTIRSDVAKAQANIGQFIAGFGQFITAVGPAVQVGFMPVDVATDLLTAFARAFKLGRQAEDALERLGQQAQQQPMPMAPPGMPHLGGPPMPPQPGGNVVPMAQPMAGGPGSMPMGVA